MSSSNVAASRWSQQSGKRIYSGKESSKRVVFCENILIFGVISCEDGFANAGPLLDQSNITVELACASVLSALGKIIL